MTKSKNTKKALLTSVLSMLLCCAMLVSSTFAWFTDSVSSGRNRIVAGNLDAQLCYKTGGMTDWRDVESLNPEENPNDVNPFFRSAGGDRILWEPGAIGITSFKVENVGTLAFKYAIALLAVKYNQLDGRDLRDVIKFAVIDGELPEGFTAEKAKNLTYSAFSDFTKRSALLPNDGVANSGADQEIFTVVAYWKPNSNNIDNLYNVSNGKIATELDGTPSIETETVAENRLYIDIDIRLNAWQDTVEEDSFDNQYDAMADALDIFPDGCYSVTNHESWVELDIYTGRSTADILISYPGYVPDNTNERMRTWTTGASGIITPTAANGNTHLIFFKTADKGSFVLTQDGRTLPELTLPEEESLRQSRVVYSARNAAAARSVSADLSNPVPVSNEADMKNVISDLNANGSKTTTVVLRNDIELTENWELSSGTLTILGDGHAIINKGEVTNFNPINFRVTGNDNATLNLGADGYNGSLTVKAGSGARSPLLTVSGNACVNIYNGTTLDAKDGWSDLSAGGLDISGTATVNMYGGSIRNCNSLTNAGGVFLYGSAKFNMNGGEITNCSGRLGGAVCMSTAISSGSTATFDAVFTMNNGTISDCSSTGTYVELGWSGYTVGGAAVCMYGSSDSYKGQFIMKGGSIIGCSTNAQSNVYGGAIFVSAGTVTLDDGKIIDNTVTAGNGKSYGGGISAYCLGSTSSPNLTITIENNFKLYNNSAEAAGDDIANVKSSSVYGTLKVLNARTGWLGAEYTEHTGGTWYTDGEGKRYKDDKGTKISLTSSPFADQTVSPTKISPYIKVVHIEEPEPVLETYVFKYGYDSNTNSSTEREERSFELGKEIEFPDPTTKGCIFNRWIFDDTQYPNVYVADYCPLGTAEARGRLLDLFNKEDDDEPISQGGAKTVRWSPEYSSLAPYVNASAPIKAGTKITMAYYPDMDDRTIVSYYYLIVPADTTTISLSSLTAMGESKHFVPNADGPCHLPGWEPKEPIYQFSFVFPEGQEDMTVWMSRNPNDNPYDTFNGTTVNISFSGERIPVPSGNLEVNGNLVTVSGLTGLAADPSDSRHNTLLPLADRKAVLAFEAVDAQGRALAMPSDTVITVGGNAVKVSAGIAAMVIADGTYTIEASALPKDAAEIRVSLCYTDNSVIHKPMANVLHFVTVKP